MILYILKLFILQIELTCDHITDRFNSRQQCNYIFYELLGQLSLLNRCNSRADRKGVQVWLLQPLQLLRTNIKNKAATPIGKSSILGNSGLKLKLF